MDLVFFHSCPYKLCVLILELSCFCSFVLCSSYVLSKFLCLFNLYILLCHFCPCHFNVVSSCSMLITAFNLVIVLSILILCSHAYKCLHYHNIFFPIPYFFLVYILHRHHFYYIEFSYKKSHQISSPNLIYYIPYLFRSAVWS
jgi:hypothetical protein